MRYIINVHVYIICMYMYMYMYMDMDMAACCYYSTQLHTYVASQASKYTRVTRRAWTEIIIPEKNDNSNILCKQSIVNKTGFFNHELKQCRSSLQAASVYIIRHGLIHTGS